MPIAMNTSAMTSEVQRPPTQMRATIKVATITFPTIMVPIRNQRRLLIPVVTRLSGDDSRNTWTDRDTLTANSASQVMIWSSRAAEGQE